MADPPVVDLCADLIAAGSENPPGGEEAAAAVVERYLGAAGFEVRRLLAAPGRPNVHASLCRGTGPRLIYQGHLDTKPSGPAGDPLRGWHGDPLRAEIRDGRLYGLGACDTKGGLAAMLVAAARLGTRAGWRGELVVQAVADEEDGSALGAEYLLGEGLLAADAAVVAEPTGCLPSVAQLGNAWAQIVVEGVPAHAGTPWRGADPVPVARRYLDTLELLLADVPRRPDFPHHPRLNVGHLEVVGHPGTAPGRCLARCDIRVLPGQPHGEVMRLYHRAAEQTRGDAQISITVTAYQGGGCESHLIDSGHPLVGAFTTAAAERGDPVGYCAFFGGSDARYFARAGTPTVVYGPGSLEQAHAPNEFTPLAQLDRAVDHLERVALIMLSGDPARTPPHA